MNRVLILLFFILFANILSANTGKSYILKVKNNLEKKVVTEKLQSQGFSIKSFLQENLIKSLEKKVSLQSETQKKALEELTKYYLIEISSDKIDKLEDLLQSEIVEFIEPNYIYRIEELESFPNDTYYKKQWALKNLKVADAWKKATGKGVLIGIIDTGIDYKHPDLVNQLWINEKEDLNKNGRFDPWPSDVQINGVFGDLNGIDDDGNGFIDDVIGYDFVDQSIMNIGDSKDIDPDVEDENGHGTSVAGVIAAEGNNKLGIIGVAYDSKIITMRAFDYSGNAESDDIAASIVYATLQGVNVLNFSFGEVYSSSIVHDAIKFAYSQGVVMVASSGNNNWTLRHYPSDYDEVICAGGSTSENARWGLSNYGNRLDIVAPAYDILTTARDSSYTTKNGTSFAAPHVVAGAALLFERDKSLTPREIAGILQTSASDFGSRGWDIEFGSGILNLKNAVNTVGKTRFEITSPKHEAFIDKGENRIEIVGSVITPLFDSYELFYGVGDKPKTWQRISEKNFNQALENVLATVNADVFIDTVYTFRLLVNLKNDNTIEKRFYIQIYSENTALKITLLKSIDCYHNERMIPVVYAVTNYPAYCRVKFRPKGSNDEYKVISELQRFSKFHSIPIEESYLQNTNMEALLEAELTNGIKIVENFEFTTPAMFVPENSFVQKDYGFPLSYVLNNVRDLYGDGKPCVVVNDLSSGGWGNIKVYQFKTNAFFTKDSYKESWIPRGIGDSNGDGSYEIFATASANSILFQSGQKGESPFSKILFLNTIDTKLWAADMVDLDGNGLAELIGFSDSTYDAYSYKNGKYQLIASANPKIKMDTYPGFASGDFDNDGKIEICFGTRYGNIFIYEFSNGNFNLEYNDSSTISSSEQYIESADVDGDGIPEIIIGNFGSTVPFGYEDASTPLWTFRVLKAESQNVYKTLDSIHIFGVRGGIDYKNGVSKGDVDNDGNDEIIISVFPNLYVFKWNADEKKFKPIWNYPYTYSNSAIVYDFDGNGLNEIGFSTFSGTRFFEIDKVQKPDIPLGFAGWSVDTNNAYFEWQPVDNAKEYELLNMVRTESGYSGYTAVVTSETSITLDTLKNNTHYEFVIRAINPDLPEQHGNISNFVDIFTHSPVEPLTAEPINENEIYVAFSGKIPNNFLNAGDFVITKASEQYSSFSTALVGSDTSAILTLTVPLRMGDYELKVNSFRDKYNSPTMEKTIFFVYIKDEPEHKLYLKQISVIDKTTLKLMYSESIDNSTCLDVNNYYLEPYGDVVGIAPDESDDSTVIIYLDSRKPLLATGKNYTLTVKDAKSEAGYPITEGAGNTIGFVFFSDGVNTAYVYPNPVKISDNKEIMFANLPSKAEIIIYNLEMKELKRLYENDGNGGTEWDGRDKHGEVLGSGVYLFKVNQILADGSSVESELKKFVIVR